MKYYIIDALGPFIDPYNCPYNWSKIPFHFYEKMDNPDISFEEIIKRFEVFIRKISQIGYNAISIDDLPHMIILDIYSPELKQKLEKFGRLYQKLVRICNENNINVFVNFDIMYFNDDIKKFTQNKDKLVIELIKESINQLFNNYEVQGVISRFGECDGIDGRGIFKSKLTLRTPKQAKRYIKEILPIFGQYNKQWIFRTWVIGGSKLGDMIWNEKTFRSVFGNINSQNLIISMKYGESDFFRNMELNPLFHLKGHKKIIELQTKREYDFFGELPYFTGWEYENFYHQLKDNSELVGIMVWCQTGGWGRSNRITFLENSSPFVELNTISTLNIFKGNSAEKEIRDNLKDSKMISFLKNYNALSNIILYPSDNTKMYLNKVYVPPIIWFYWGNVSINGFTASFVKYLYKRCPKIENSEFEELRKLGRDCNMVDIDFYIDTLSILYCVRKTLHSELSEEQMSQNIAEYAYKCKFLSFSLKNPKYSKKWIFLFNLIFRKDKKYRIIDKILLNKIFITYIPHL